MLMLFALLLAGTAVAVERPAMLPVPREVQYGAGRFAFSGAAVSFASAPNEEDRLVGKALSEALGLPVRASGGSVVLVRTAPAAPVNWDEPEGPESGEAYTLSVKPRKVTITSKTARGLFYGVQTLRQLQRGGVAPEVEIRDWPASRYRGFMLDLSHGPLPKFEEIKRIIDFLARWKLNQFYFYSEGNIVLSGYRLLNARARYSQAQVRAIVQYARERFIDVVPCLELYGHLHDLLRIEKYSDLGEMPHGGELNPRDPRVHALVADWVKQFAALFPSPFMHIGLDETYELGKAPGRELSSKEAGELYIGFFERVASAAHSHGKRVMVWADILLQHPEIIPRLKAGTIAFPWRYSDEPSYDKFVQPFAAARVQFLPTSGVWNYNEIAPDFDHTVRNVDGLLGSGRKFGSGGLLHTAWTDDGQLLMRMAWPGFAYGPVATWQEKAISRDEFYDLYARIMFPGHDKPVAAALRAVSEANAGLEKALGGRSMHRLWADPLDPANLARSRKHADLLRQSRLRAEDAQEALLQALDAGADRSLEPLLFGARLLDYAALKNIYALEMEDYHRYVSADPRRNKYSLLFRVESAEQNHSRAMDLMDALSELRRDYERLWLEEYTPFRMGTALSRWTAEQEYWRVLQERMLALYWTFPEGGPMPPLDTFRRGVRGDH